MKITFIIIIVIILLLMGISELLKLSFLRTFLVSTTFIALTVVGEIFNVACLPYEISLTITIVAMITLIIGIVLTHRNIVTEEDYWPILFKRLFIFAFIFLGVSLYLILTNPNAIIGILAT